MVLLEPAPDPPELEFDDLPHDLVRDRVEGDDDHPPEEGRLEDLVQLRFDRLHELFGLRGGLGIGAELHHRVGCGIGGQDDDGVLEVDLPPFAVLENPLVEDLVEELHDVGVRLLDLVEEDDGVRAASNRLGQDAPLAVADIARRRALERRDRVRLLVLAHVDRDEVPLPAVERLGQRDGGFGLADAARPDEQKDADGPARIREVRAGSPDPTRDRLEGVRLADDALLEPVLQREDRVDLVRQHLPDRDPGPPGDDLGDGLRVDASLHEGRFALHLLELPVEGLELGPERRGVRGRRRGRGGCRVGRRGLCLRSRGLCAR